MNFKSYTEFTADFPDDQVEDDDGIVIFGGRNVAEAVAEIIRSGGYDVAPPDYMDEHGWDLNVYVNGKRIWLELQAIGPEEIILQTEAMVGFFRRLFGVDLTYYAEFLTKLNEGLRQHPRFSSVGWFELRNERPVGDPQDDPLRVMDSRG